MSSIEQTLKILFEEWSGEKAETISLLPGQGSWRKYYRITGKKSKAIGVANDDLKENHAFLSFSRHFASMGLPVPAVLSEGDPPVCYLVTDLGDETLFGYLSSQRSEKDAFPGKVEGLYEKVIGWLPSFQVTGGKGLDYSACYPRAEFDRQSMMWDLNYFKYYFLKLARISFDEQRLEDDFNKLTSILLKPDRSYFMYRDFQSRNIMLVKNEPYFIDFQGGRRGPLQYDIASLLYDAKAAIPEPVRERLLDLYIRDIKKLVKIDEASFRENYRGFVLIRIFQALGAYGFRGYYENKPHFLQSIPYAIANLEYLLKNNLLPQGIPVLTEIIRNMVGNQALRNVTRKAGHLKVSIYSFSYRENIPEDKAGNGGGFVFDCRSLPNPGRLEEFRRFSGKDQPVIDFLKKEQAVDEFLAPVFSIVDQSVGVYLEREFSNLMVSFGCTGGQHRSVYCAEELAKHLQERFPIDVRVIHTKLA